MVNRFERKLTDIDFRFVLDNFRVDKYWISTNVNNNNDDCQHCHALTQVGLNTWLAYDYMIVAP